MSTLRALSPLDGRYAQQVAALSEYLSEFALHRYRVRIELLYLIALSDQLPDSVRELSLLRLRGHENDAQHSERARRLRAALLDIAQAFTDADGERIRELERTTNHDVKAVEYFLKERIGAIGQSQLGGPSSLVEVCEFVHFGLTSQDLNNTAIPMALRDAMRAEVLPALRTGVLTQLHDMARRWLSVPMLARTHGQPATPTRIGKELMVFVERLETLMQQANTLRYSCKFGGAVGLFNAHVAAVPSVDWPAFADRFVRDSLGLDARQQFTTQIEHYDDIAALCHWLTRVNTVLLDLCRDVWQYISMEYFRLRVVAHEVGSSTMPHKVNPIDFENAEGNLGIANALLLHLASKLPVSRLQRDLSDSTALRNLGVPLGHSVVAFNSLRRGLAKLELNEAVLRRDLDSHVEILAEAIQTILRRERYPNPYEALKELTRTGHAVERQQLLAFIDGLQGVSDAVKDELRALDVHTYIGVVPPVVPPSN